MNTTIAFFLSWFWSAMAPLTAIESNAGPSASPPPPSCATAPSSPPTGSEAAGPCKSGSSHTAAPRRGDSIYNGI